MKRWIIISSLLLVGLLVAGAIWYYRTPQINSWSTTFPDIGSSSSVRLTDLTGDGILDVVLGTGWQELQATDTGVVALDGRNGQLLWRASARDQMVGSATLLDINQDGTQDIIIGGRSAELIALDGPSGKVIWEFYPAGDTIDPGKSAGLYNFYNPQRIPDQDEDGVEDLLVANGGDYLAEPDDPKRPTGNLLVISGQSGKLLAQASVPDGKETYLSAVVSDLDDDGELDVIYGTGGETMGGNLYRTTLTDILSQDLSRSTVLANGNGKGFIAPPVLVDITQDGTLDVVANSVDGRMLAFSGESNTLLWERKIPDSEAYTTPAVGYFNEDEVPDFFANYGKGQWPTLRDPCQFMVDGKTGQVLSEDSLGRFQYASAVVVDINKDGFDEVILSVNYLEEKFDTQLPYNRLVVFDFHQQQTFRLDEPQPGINVASTPWIGDLDRDGWLDVIYCVAQVDPNNSDLPRELTIHRMEKQIRLPSEIRWGSYMGSDYSGVFRDRNLIP